MGFDKFGWVTYTSQSRIGKFIDYLEEGKIYGTKCKECGLLQFPPRAHCMHCLSTNFEWKELSGVCTLATYTKVESPPAAFKEQAPYLLGLARFNEGPEVFAWIDKGIPEEEIRVGMKLQLKVIKLANGNLAYVLRAPIQA